MRKKILSLILSCLCFGAAANAEVLGEVTGGWSTDMGADTYFHAVQYTSPGIGKQSEYYVEYTPNSDAVPVVINGESIWGTRDIEEAEEYMIKNGLRPLVGINADYFSFKTGIPMGHTIINGEIASKEYGGQDAVGFRADGTGFIKWLDIKTTLSDGQNSIDIMYINKWCQAGFDPVYLLTDKFGQSSKTESNCIFVICSPDEGKLAIGETVKMTVDDVFVYDGAIEIPDGKMVFVMDTSGQADLYDFLSRCYKGQKLTVTNEAVGDDGTWQTAEHGLSTVGGRLVSEGVANAEFEAGAAPRTAVGIEENGNIIFYTIDGRQLGHSYGAQLKTLAKRMVELGCKDAINLDGGGSTTISALFPGKDFSMVVNSPSDGYLRNVSNFIFLKDNRQRTDIPWIANLNATENDNYISGMSTQISVEGVYDTSNYKMDNYGITYRMETDTMSSVDESGYVYFDGTGLVNVIAQCNGIDVATKTYAIYETPEEIKIYNQADWKEINEIHTQANEELQLNLSAASYVNGVELNSNNRMFTWEIEGNIGTVTEDGIFTLANTVNEEGSIIIRAGEYEKVIPVTISDYPKTPNPFYDTQGHWAESVIAEMAATGIINGLEIDGQMVFRPDNNITRAEFASMIVNYNQLDMSAYENTSLDFADASDIPLWAENVVKTAYGEGLILGRVNDDGSVTFAPNDNITRAEAMTIIGRMLVDNPELTELPFADTSDIPQWAVDGIRKLYALGITNGYEDGTILPLNNMKRAEAAVMLYNVGE